MLVCISLLAMLCVYSGCRPETPVEEVSVEQTDAGEELPALDYGPTDWPYWRGPTQDGKPSESASAEKPWTSLENELWKIKVPGRGHSSPVIYGNQVFLTTADDAAETQSLLAFDRDSGDELWTRQVHQGNFPSDGEMHRKSTNASPTPACDGERVFALFLNDAQLYLSAYSLTGEQLWQTSTGAYISRFGLGPSPVLYQSYVIVASEHSGGGNITAVHRKTGKVAWRVKRTRADTYSSPAIFNIDGTDHMILSGANEVVSLDPANGKTRWSIEGTAKSTCGTAVRWNDLILVSGGYPERETMGIRVGAKAEKIWSAREKLYIPSLITFKGHVLGLNDDGIACCWEVETGKQTFKTRTSSGYAASPVLDGDQIIILNEQGMGSILNQNPNELESVSERSFGTNAMASPAISGDRLYLRVAEEGANGRQEYLYCLQK
ncbi:outer membrane biogenesis protein BamB [Polystyrenella longa]|uniref:Outer membrane biogenesis protein BamB n=2 Tax=Polystyrenella longa TaxID=2528007 RepID=A0A518CI13_9PLAN|nr:outer membrane biogenesis protein BamB [Polystyrenella longa]